MASLCKVLIARRVAEEARKLMRKGYWEDAWALAAEKVVGMTYLPASREVTFTRLLRHV